MNPEQVPQEPAPRHRAEIDEEDAALATGDRGSDALTELVASAAATPEAVQAVTSLYARYGTAFALYLALDRQDRRTRQDGPDQRGEAAMEADFHSSYHGRLEDRDAVVSDTIASFGWDRDLRHLLASHPDLAAVVSFDRDAVYGVAADHHQLIHGSDGSIYVFKQWP